MEERIEADLLAVHGYAFAVQREAAVILNVPPHRSGTRELLPGCNFERCKTKARHSSLNTGPSVLLVIDQGVIPYETVAAVIRTARQLSHGGTTSIIGTVR